jgi:L-aspartate oxidase
MASYSELGDLAPRDEVSRAMYEEMIKRGDAYVYLEIASIHGDKRQETVPHDIPAMPRLRYRHPEGSNPRRSRGPLQLWRRAGGHLGEDFSQMSLRGGRSGRGRGLHGANRLASTSLLEGLVWGIRAAKDIAANFNGNKPTRNRTYRPGSSPNAWRRSTPPLFTRTG